MSTNILKLNEQYGFNTANTIFNANNPYGFKINISHPKIYPLYIRFKKSKNLPLHFPISDKQRAEFEEHIMKMLEHKKENQLIPTCK